MFLHLCTLVCPGRSKGSVLQGLPDSDLGARGSLLSSGLGLTSPERSLPPEPRGVAGSAGERCRPAAWAPGGQTRETSAWKLEERPAPGLTRVSMETCVLHVAPLLPADGCWYLGSQPKTPCRCQRRHFRRSSACTWEKENGQARPKEASRHADWAAVHLGCGGRQSYPLEESNVRGQMLLWALQRWDLLGARPNQAIGVGGGGSQRGSENAV